MCLILKYTLFAFTPNAIDFSLINTPRSQQQNLIIYISLGLIFTYYGIIMFTLNNIFPYVGHKRACFIRDKLKNCKLISYDSIMAVVIEAVAVLPSHYKLNVLFYVLRGRSIVLVVLEKCRRRFINKQIYKYKRKTIKH